MAILASYPMRNIFIYGGSFDPIHMGHLNTAQRIFNVYKPDEFFFMPCKQSVLKDATQATVKQRLEMLRLGIQSLNKPDSFKINDFELKSTEPSYTINTIRHLHQEYQNTAQLVFIMGADAFNNFHHWHQYQAILELCKLLVIARPGYSLDSASNSIEHHLQKFMRSEPTSFLKASNGHISTINCGTYLESSSEIRQKIRQGHSVNTQIPLAVAQYIEKEDLYRKSAP